jgi:predicted acylesterase/phospholipase RssA
MSKSRSNRDITTGTPGLDRLVRALRGISVGIALAGGGAKGMAHFGVLAALEQAGLSFDAMSGTSAGAMAGILYASGMSPQQAIKNFQHDLTPSRLFRYLPKWPNWYWCRNTAAAWDGMLRNICTIGVWSNCRYHSTPSRSIWCKCARWCGARATRSTRSLRASTASRLKTDSARRHGPVDGGVLNNSWPMCLPKAADFVVGVDVSSHIRPEFAGNRPDTPTGK